MIEFHNINFRYAGGTDAGGLVNINLIIPDGQVILLCGQSGCGKTTLTRLVNGLIPNYYEGELSGEVLLDGKNISRLPLYETAKYVGSVFQNPRTQFFTVDSTSELAFGCENQGLPEEEIIPAGDIDCGAVWDGEPAGEKYLFSFRWGKAENRLRLGIDQ